MRRLVPGMTVISNLSRPRIQLARPPTQRYTAEDRDTRKRRSHRWDLYIYILYIIQRSARKVEGPNDGPGGARAAKVFFYR